MKKYIYPVLFVLFLTIISCSSDPDERESDLYGFIGVLITIIILLVGMIYQSFKDKD